jgi:5-(carboxyamino)imidazole ribonucleotide mutase
MACETVAMASDTGSATGPATGPATGEGTSPSSSAAAPVAVIMGSDSDYRVLSAAVDVLGELGVGCEARVVSAHRTPLDMVDFAQTARDRGVQVIIAGAGGAAHLPGMVASLTTLPVIGVPVDATTLSGLDALLSIVQMPKGVPVATMAVDGARNAGLLAARILSLGDDGLAERLAGFADGMAAAARAGNDRLPH